jgi:transcription antitermination factor NusG
MLLQRDPLTGTDGREARPGPLPPPWTPALSGWFALQVRANREFRVTAELVRLKFETFLPVVRESHRWSDRDQVIERPIFPGYVFARLTHGDFRCVLRISGVCHILGSTADTPEMIPDSQIEDVKRVLESRVTARPSPYEAGQTVRIEKGPLAGVTGIVREIAGETTLIVGIELMKRAIRVKLDAGDLAAA